VSQKASEAPYHKGPARHAVALQPPAPPILTDRSVSTRERRRRQYVRLADSVMPLHRYYRHHGGPLLAVPIGEFYVRGRWAA
jgi:hypothetical protein